MRKKLWTKIGCTLLSAFMVFSLVACGNDGSSSTTQSSGGTTGSSKADQPTGKKETVSMWYLWSGAEGELVADTAKDFDAQSDKYQIESLCVPDQQKIKIAIAANDGPDLVDDFSYSIGAYVAINIMEPLDEYVKKNNIDLYSIHSKGALESCQYNGLQYALPINSMCSALFYNKDLLEAAGYKEPPKTLEEMSEMAVKMTKVNADGTIDTLGFPCFPGYAFVDIQGLCGGSWYVNGKPTIENPGNVQAMKYLIDYRKQFGVDAVSAFTTAGKNNDPSDPFFQGKQAFRIDGSWLPTMIEKTFKVDINYGMAPVPYPEDKPELAGTINVASSMFFIPKTAKNKDGAFEALLYLTGPIGQEKMTFGMGSLPSAKELLVDSNSAKFPGMEFFAAYSNSDKTFATEQYPEQTDLGTIITEETELAFNLKQSAEDTIKKISERSASLFK